MSETELQRQARFDQINAGHREVCESIRRVDAGLFTMTPEDRQRAVSMMSQKERCLVLAVAGDLGIQRLVDLLAGKEGSA